MVGGRREDWLSEDAVCGLGILLVKLDYLCGVGKGGVRIVCLVFTFNVFTCGHLK